MSSVFAVTFPFFALVLIGYLAARRGMLSITAIPDLNSFVLYFALPCMLFRFGAGAPLAQLLDPRTAAVYLGAGILMVALALLYARRGGWNWNDAAFGALVTAFPNTGFMGVPLIVALLSQAAAGPVVQVMAIDMVITSSACIALSRLDGAGAHGMAMALRQALRGMLVNPLPWSVLLGGLASAAGLRLPQPVDQTLALLGNAAPPVALFTIGAVLARSQMGHDTAVGWTAYVPLAIAKLVLHPLLVLGGAALAAALGVPLPPVARAAIVLVAALPAASNVAVLAERFGAHNGRIARIIMVSTVFAFLSFSAAVAWVGP
ncbi:AEC family transporter [Xylophilus rhododendri]|uniref:AEC family transporter n=1 Tax=Xylophilus rhododendri TaxID=2697032 RepID=A0A857J5U4_9BURK|nr:AEC family transporter [Xylophilus rhododendri]QHI98392.1 AEC family transporter [Xylophilus rhododendri]